MGLSDADWTKQEPRERPGNPGKYRYVTHEASGTTAEQQLKENGLYNCEIEYNGEDIRVEAYVYKNWVELLTTGPIDDILRSL
ncbi:MAG: hypothetical protein SVW02_00390 [Candidatus Nanohaloarchaea archaeon]|nr:hypothetical protein [Candidatus Nanohaloarchaea archaeon]